MTQNTNDKRDIRLIGLDLDGTLLTSEKVFPPHSKEVIENCLRNGIQVLPATGRTKSAIPDFLKQIEGIRYILASNGAAIVDLDTDETIYENGIPWERGLELYDILETYGTYYDSYIDGCGYCEDRFYDHLDRYEIEPLIEKLILESRKRITDLREYVREHKKPIEKINMFFADPKYRDQVAKELEVYEDIKVTCSLVNNLEINYCTCNKGDALLNLGRLLNISQDQIMACGDGNNDIEMIDMAGFGVAMENAVDAVKEVSDFITKNNDEEGVAYAIETFVKGI